MNSNRSCHLAHGGVFKPGRGLRLKAVFTSDRTDMPGQPTRGAVDEVIAFFRKALLEIEANFKKEALTVTLPKRPEAQRV